MGVGSPGDAVVSLAFEAVGSVWRRGPTLEGHALCHEHAHQNFGFPTEPSGLPTYPLCDKEDEMGNHKLDNNTEEIDEQDDEERLERVAAIDVAKATGTVCVRLPHRSVPGRRTSRVFEVSATTNAIMALADELFETGIERVVIESTSDYWRGFFYLLEARGLCVW
ncbi:MAG: hypothetical protein ACRDZ5_08880, partial [Acidimicrobiales bacterium]